MLGFGRHAALVVLAKLLLVVGGLVLLQIGTGYLGAGVWVIALHGVVLVAIVAFVFWARARHRDLVGRSALRVDDKVRGIVLHGAAGYDWLARVRTLGCEARFRDSMLRWAEVQPGEAVLDVACGTGTLAIAAKHRVGGKGSVTGIDASAEMIERACAKARRTGLDVAFVNGTAQHLPFDDGQFDIVMGTLMLHHLPKPMRSDFAREAWRVLKPDGRLLLIDFGKPARRSRWLRLHRHGHVDMPVIAALLAQIGFEIRDSGAVGTMNLNCVRANRVHTRN